MNYEDAIQKTESEWEPDAGFFWNIRQGLFSEAELQWALTKVSSISIPDGALVSKRLGSLLWTE
ncbi:MAG: hypothetical protein ACREBG_01150 [Pyrinomonadaceae bacterium]